MFNIKQYLLIILGGFVIYLLSSILLIYIGQQFRLVVVLFLFVLAAWSAVEKRQNKELLRLIKEYSKSFVDINQLKEIRGNLTQ